MAKAKEQTNGKTVVIEIPVSDEKAGGFLDELPRHISSTGLNGNELAKQGLRRLYRAVIFKQRTSKGTVVKTNSLAIQWLLEQIANA